MRRELLIMSTPLWVGMGVLQFVNATDGCGLEATANLRASRRPSCMSGGTCKQGWEPHVHAEPSARLAMSPGQGSISGNDHRVSLRVLHSDGLRNISSRASTYGGIPGARCRVRMMLPV